MACAEPAANSVRNRLVVHTGVARRVDAAKRRNLAFMTRFPLFSPRLSGAWSDLGQIGKISP